MTDNKIGYKGEEEDEELLEDPQLGSIEFNPQMFDPNKWLAIERMVISGIEAVVIGFVVYLLFDFVERLFTL